MVVIVVVVVVAAVVVVVVVIEDRGGCGEGSAVSFGSTVGRLDYENDHHALAKNTQNASFCFIWLGQAGSEDFVPGDPLCIGRLSYGTDCHALAESRKYTQTPPFVFFAW